MMLEPLGPSWEPFGAHFGVVKRWFGGSWAQIAGERRLGRSGGPLGELWGQSGGRLGPLLGAHWGNLGAVRGRLGAILGPSWAVLGRLGAILGRLGAP